MKKFFASLLFIFCLGIVGSVSAAVQEFGPYFSRFTVDVPVDWTAEKNDKGVTLSKSDQSCYVVIGIDKTRDQDARTLCKAMAKDVGVQEVQKIQSGEDGCTLVGLLKGVQTAITVKIDGDKYLGVIISSINDNMSAASPILESLKNKGPAAEQEFGPSFSRFTIVVPDGWTAEKVDNGVVLYKDDHSISLTIVVDKNNGFDAEALGKGIAKEAGMEVQREQPGEGGTYTLQGVLRNVKTAITVTTEGDKFLCISVSSASDDMSAAAPILNSLRGK